MLLRACHLLPGENLRIRRLTTDAGERLIGRVLQPEDAMRLCSQGDSDATFELPAKDILEAVIERGARFPLANGWILARRGVLERVLARHRLRPEE